MKKGVTDVPQSKSIFEISYADTLRFRRIVMDVMSSACNADYEYDGIGTLGEKHMHAAIKRFVCPDESKHEIKLDAPRGPDEKSKGRRRFVADVLDGNTVYEIQTGSLAPLVKKLDWIMENTDLNVTVIHPIAEVKWVNIIGDDGHISKRYKSPRADRLNDIAGELYYIRHLLDCPRFSLVILSCEAEQYKKNAEKPKRRGSKYQKYELIPVNLLRAQVFFGLDSYKHFIPESLVGAFTVKQYSAATKIRGSDAYSIVHTLCDAGLLREAGKVGRAMTYEKTY